MLNTGNGVVNNLANSAQATDLLNKIDGFAKGVLNTGNGVVNNLANSAQATDLLNKIDGFAKGVLNTGNGVVNNLANSAQSAQQQEQSVTTAPSVQSAQQQEQSVTKSREDCICEKLAKALGLLTMVVDLDGQRYEVKKEELKKIGKPLNVSMKH